MRFVSIGMLLTCLAVRAAAQYDGALADLHEGAIRYWSESLYERYLHKAENKKDSSRLVIIWSLKGLHHIIGREYPEAEKLLLTCAAYASKEDRIRKKSVNYLTVFDCYDYLGKLYAATGNFRRADYYLELSYRVKTRNFSAGSTARLLNLQFLADYYLTSGRWIEAETYLNRLQHDLKRTRYANRIVRDCYNVYLRGMTRISLQKGDLSQAKRHLDKAYEVYNTGDFGDIFRPVRESKVDDELKLLKASYLVAAGQYAAASSLLSDIRSSKDALLAAKVKRLKLQVALRKDDIREAVTLARDLAQQDADNISQNFHLLSEVEKEAFNKSLEGDMEWLASLAYRASSANVSFDWSGLLELRMRTKGILLSNARALREAIVKSGNSGLQSQFNKLTRYRNEIARLSTSRSLLDFGKSEERISQLRDSIDIAERAVSAGAQSLSAALNENITAAMLQQKLPQGSHAVEVIRFSDMLVKASGDTARSPVRYLFLIVGNQSLDHVFVDNGGELEIKYLKAYANLRGDFPELYAKFWSFLEQYLPAGSQVVVSPDGAYLSVNVNTLSDGSKFVFDRWDVSIVTNLRDLAQPSGDSLTSAGTAVFFARPDFKYVSSSGPPDRDVTLEDLKTAKFSDLPGTEQEVNLAQQTLEKAGWKTEVKKGAAAQESALRQIENPTILHIATHGFFLRSQNTIDPMLESGLIFAGVNTYNTSDNQDGILTAYEASSLALTSTKLVVLSACQTGLGEVRNGEGVYGLQRAFSIAGAQTIIMSLWKVDDEATQQLMTRFYQNLASTGSVRESFIEAQRHLRLTYPSPGDWGAFVVSGKGMR